MLTLLVGANPLPNYLSVLALRPDKIALVYSPKTEPVSERLEHVLKKSLDHVIEIAHVCVADPSSAKEVRDHLKQLMEKHSAHWQISLNYTGGTKVMAASALHLFYDKGGKPEEASYLDDGGLERHPRLLFDDGTVRTLAECATPPLKLDVLLDLHGWRLQLKSPYEPAPTQDDVNELAKKILEEPKLAEDLYKELRNTFGEEKDPKNCVNRPFEDFRIALSISKFPTEEQIQRLTRDQRKSWFRHWRRFIGGCWLEDWVTARIAETGLIKDGCDVVSGFQVFRQTPGDEKSAQLEIDVALVRNYRSYFISCTTETDKGPCKRKLFEIAVRSRQLAGDLARPALVCLADGRTLGELRGEVDDEPSPAPAFRVRGIASVHVFGLEDLRAWSGWQGAPPNLESLKSWLES